MNERDRALRSPARRYVDELDALRRERDQRAWEGALDALHTKAAGDGNLVPAIIDAVKAGATLGEVSDALRAVFGEHRELITV